LAIVAFVLPANFFGLLKDAETARKAMDAVVK
jgi:hypothetical protein